MRAVVTGIAGQDGYYMASLLLGRGFEVLGLTSNEGATELDLSARFPQHFRMLLFDYDSPLRIGELLEDYRPAFIFNFAAKATGEGMFNDPYRLTRLNGGFVIDILEALRNSDRREQMVLCQASSSEMFGKVSERPQSESTAFWPQSPYGAAKLYAHHMIGIYRRAYGVRCCSAILYNHESVRRSTRFVTKKIARGAALIKLGLLDSLALGDLDAQRDWGYAPEYVDAMYRMACADTMDDFVVATGQLTTVRQLCEIAFGHLDLKYTDYVRTNEVESRVAKSMSLHGDPRKINAALGWRASTSVGQIMVELVEHELAQARTDARE
jgi:GDPmannose 4,6-dehydratase